ncbi:MAG: TetR/AcrR family transcriptional regulator [Solirubrobacterales bacterium]
MTPDYSPRQQAIADAAIAILGRDGGRALTHRAVDRFLGLPLGSAGNLFPTRASLLLAATERIFELDMDVASLPDLGALLPEAAAELILERFREVDESDELLSRTRARVELQLESPRHDEIRSLLVRGREEFTQLAERLLTAIGTQSATTEAPALTAIIDGLLLQRALFPDQRLTDESLRRAVLSLLQGMAAT